MSSSISLWRLTWKEYRTQRSLWLAVLVLTGLFQTSISVVAAVNHAPIPAAAYLVMAFVSVAVYMLGCGATMFALEHEHGTFDFQRMLPAPAWQVYVSKLGVGFASGIVLLATLFVLSHLFFIGWHSVLAPADWLAGCVAFTEVFVWAVLFSLVLRHPLRAAVCGIIAMSVTVCIILPLTNALPWEEDVLIYHRNFLGARIGIVALLLAIDTWLTWRWFDGRIGWPPSWSARTRRTSDTWLVPAGPIPAYIAARPIGWWRLVGITWRQGWWLIVLQCGLFLWFFVQLTTTGRSLFSSDAGGLGFVVVTGAILFGLCAFTLDQWSHQFRFYAERGVNPRWLWLSRHAVWFSPIIVQAICVQWLTNTLRPTHSPLDEFLIRLGWLLIVGTLYGLGQLCGMLIRSTLVAGVVSYFAALMSWCWMLLMLAGGIPQWWSVLPIPIVALLTTWWFSKDWIEERHDRRHWTQMALVVGAPSLAILIGCALHRAYEIPAVDPGFVAADYTRPMTPAEQETLKIYDEADRVLAQEERALERALPFANQNPQEVEERQRKWLEVARPALTLLERAHDRTPAPLTLITGPSSRSSTPAADFLGSGNPIGFFLIVRLQAESLTREDKLSEAWRWYEIGFELLRRFRLRATDSCAKFADNEEKSLLDSVVRWSSHPQQTPDRIRVALAKLEGVDSQESNLQRSVKIKNVLWKEFFHGKKIDPAEIGLTPAEVKGVWWLGTLLPWETTRSLHALDLFTLAILDPAVAERQVHSIHDSRMTIAEPTLIPLGRLPGFAATTDSTIQLRRRATRILVALIDWQREHGKLPESLNELVGNYFRDLPLDPMAGRPFTYFPRGGISIELVARPMIAGESPTGIRLPKETSFLWSPLATGTAVERGADGTYRAQSRGATLAFEETLVQGLPWLIPIVEPRQ